MPNDDLNLLREYARNHSEEAFAALASRHVNLVYSVALRQVGNAHLAEEITQAVFIILARKAESLGDKTILPGWLCRTARYISNNALTIQRRRQHREQEAHMQSILNEAGPMPEASWNQIAPLLDGAMEQLGQKDHDALVLRFFENKTFAEVGASLGASEDAAKMRVNRALEKMRTFFTKRGVNSTTAIIAGTISANSVQAAPVALAKAVTAAVIAKGAAASISTLTLTKATLITMKTKTILTTAVAAVVILGAGVYFSKLEFAGRSSPPSNIVLPIQLANEASKRAADDPFFQIGLDPDTRRTSNSAPAIHIKGPVTSPSGDAPDFSDADQQKSGNSSAAEYAVRKGSPLLGKRIRITGWLKSSNVQNWAAAYMYIWTRDKGLCRLDTMDNRDDRPILRGTMDWQQIEFVTDVPNEPCFIYVGPDLYGPGELWGDDFQIALAPSDSNITDDRIWRHTSESPGTYSQTTDYIHTHNDRPTVCLAYTSRAAPDGAWMWWGRKIHAPDIDKYKGHAMRMSGWVKLENVSGRLQPCVRPWDNTGKWGKDSMSEDYSLRGTLDWTQFTVTGVVAKDAKHIDTPFIFWGGGKVWIDMDSLKFEVVN
jgi:RNA polymerase sigma factor (sigma-70 family)